MKPFISRPFLPGLIAALLTAIPAAAATLRGSTTLDSPVVKLSDLFDDAGSRADRVLGPAPGPGNRIVVEAAQLGAIARQFGVDWHPSGGERIVLERPGRMLGRQPVIDALRTALSGVGAPDDCDFDLPGFVAPTVPLHGDVSVAVEQLDYDAASGRFTATLSLSGQDLAMQPVRVSGRVQQLVEMSVLTRRLPKGAVLRPGDVKIAQISAGLRHGEPIDDPDAVVGMVLKHPGVPGTPLTRDDLTRPAAVEKGARVMLELTMPGLSVTGQGLALEAGPIGAHIQVQNTTSRAVLDGEVIAANLVRVTPDSMPLNNNRPGGPHSAQVAIR